LVDFTVKSDKEYCIYIAKRRAAEEEYAKTRNEYKYKNNLRNIRKPFVENYITKIQ